MASRWTDVYRSPRVVHASPAASLLFYISLEVAKPDLNLRSSSMWPKPSSSSVNGGSSKATGAMERKMFFIPARAGGETAAHSHSTVILGRGYSRIST